MLKKFKYAKILVVFLGVLSYYQPVYAQRASTTIERNEDAKEINDLYKQGKWEAGKNRAEEHLKKNPRDSDMRMLVGKYYTHRQQYDKARYELVKSLEYAPANVESKHMLVTVETETQRFSSAICYINELLEVNPYWKGLWRKKIELYRTMGNHVEADRLLKRISQIYPEDSELKGDQAYAQEQRAVTVAKAGRIDETIEVSKKRIDEQPRQQDSYFAVIDNYIKAGDYNNALVYTERALNEFPGNGGFVQKKIAILEHQQRYPEILSFLEFQMKRGGGSLRSQYNYFLLEAARAAKNSDPASLYGKIFESSPSNKEAFEYVFNDHIAKEQYEEAIVALHKHRYSAGTSKDLDMRELMAYKRMGNEGRIAALTREYFVKYPTDFDLRDSYVTMTLRQAKTNMQDGKIGLAVNDWKDIIRYGDEESVAIAQSGLYNAYVVEKRYQEAIMVLDDLLLDRPGDTELLLKKSDLYNKEGRYEYAISIYEQVLGGASLQDRNRLMHGYNDMVQPWVKSLKERYQLTEARQLCDRWLTIDEKNQEALLYMINICYQLKDKDAMLRYAQIAEDRYGDDVAFKIKLAEAMNHSSEKRPDSWALLHRQVQLNPYHEPLINTFSHTTEEYAGQLLKQKEHYQALTIIDTALYYQQDNKVLKYMKGLAYEGLKQYDSAYRYQQFYEPSLLEFAEFKSHLDYLGQKSYQNNVSVSHIRARYGDDYAITSISTVEYSRFLSDGNSYTARLNYAGREEGKGVQGQVEWFSPWTEKLSTRIDLALANKFFAKLAINGTALYVLRPTWEAEGGLGYRRLFTRQNLFNLNLGMAKEIEDFRLSAKWSNFFLDSEGEGIYLYSLGGRAQYFMHNPKNYLLAVGSIGNSPDIDLLNTQFYNSFNVFNVMVGAGLGRSITKNIGASVMGTWYNFQTDNSVITGNYRNLYNLYFQFHVAF
ncbi:tetratricopeptide repeat protein [Sphingobacterium faecale]|uniref:Tetratricopeptide repeat protein n=1 Tax=Sphingobacterium faecale TaxID=2803775 RepID=A0ABS1R2W8_9SPHI|nr:tetratricopeptide repeat protein [Sphingobacterium faecale]MBL1409055.1 tetratricopeptide repeat protein [Sphingobacterium faecale]